MSFTVLEQDGPFASGGEQHETIKLFHICSLCIRFCLKYKCAAELDTGNRFVGRYSFLQVISVSTVQQTLAPAWSSCAKAAKLIACLAEIGDMTRRESGCRKAVAASSPPAAHRAQPP